MLFPDLTSAVLPVLFAPPYHEAIPVRGSAQVSPIYPAGTVLCLKLDSLSRGWADLNIVLPHIWTHFPTIPVVLHLSACPASDIDIVRRVGRLAVRGVTVDPVTEPTLRRILSCPDDIGGDVVEWLAFRGFRFGPALGRSLEMIFSRATGHRLLGDLLRENGEAEGTLRRRLQKKYLPPPNAWFCAARSVTAMLRLQADPGLSLSSISHEHDHADHSALSQQILRCLGSRPSHLRALLGWEWMIEQWLNRDARTRAVVERYDGSDSRTARLSSMR
jgi:hypothetical protein